jgi:hypothetical protein
MFALWANRQALNTDNWTDTSTKLLADEDVQNAVGAYLVTELFSEVDVAQKLRDVLPPQAAPLAGPLAGGLQQLAGRAAPRLVASPRVQDAWRLANRSAHQQLLRILNDEGSAVSTKGGEVVLNLRPLVDQLAANIGVEDQVNAARSKLQGDAGAKARAAAQQKLGVTLPQSTGQLVIMRSDQLATAQDVGHGIRNLAIVLLGLTLALFALAVGLATGWRRVALLRVGWCFIGLGLLVLLARRVIGNQVIDDLVANKSAAPAAHSVWTIGTSLLYDIAIATFAYGVLMVLAAWLAGPRAVAVRGALAPSLRYRLARVYGLLAIVYLLVLVWGPTAATRKPLGIILFAALLVLGVELLRRQVAREFPDAREGETMDRFKAWASARRHRDAPATATAPGRVGDLERLAALHDSGVLSDEEFNSEKVLILDGR